MILDAPTAEEFPFIFDSWARSFRRSPWAGCVPNHLYDAVSRECSRGIVDRGATVIVARPDDVARVMGYAVWEPGVLYFLYVKEAFRRMGVGSALLKKIVPSDSDGWVYTHRTRASQGFLGPRFKWDPIPSRIK